MIAMIKNVKTVSHPPHFCAPLSSLLTRPAAVRRGRTAHNALVLLAFVLIFVTMALSVQFQVPRRVSRISLC
jgi:hypothetical protein